MIQIKLEWNQNGALERKRKHYMKKEALLQVQSSEAE